MPGRKRGLWIVLNGRRRHKNIHTLFSKKKSLIIARCAICGRSHSTVRCWNITRVPVEQKQIVKTAGLFGFFVLLPSIQASHCQEMC